MKKAKILFPNLHQTFKNTGQIHDTPGPLPPIRQHWNTFLMNLRIYLEMEYEVEVIKRPLWQFTYEFCMSESKNCDLIFIPHKQRIDFGIPNAMYYMQTVFPDKFTIDENGWGASLSWIDDLNLDGENLENVSIFNTLKTRLLNNVSKFDQPVKNIDVDDFDLFVCQIPHDETIKYHSSVSVYDALKSTLAYAWVNNRKVVVKGHPVNPGSMESLKKLTETFNQIWVDDVSLLSCLQKANNVFLVNSGVGFEAILLEKPIFRFGDAEYRNIVPELSLGFTELPDQRISMHRNANFIGEFVKKCL